MLPDCLGNASPSVAINPTTGRLTFGNGSVSLNSPLDDLAPVFERRDGVVYRDGAQWPCVFATAVHWEQGTRFDFSLLYENAKLVRVSLCMEPPQFRDLPGDAFYESVDARYAYHQAWLQSMRLQASAYTKVEWGVVGVGRDKSENVFIYLNAV